MLSKVLVQPGAFLLEIDQAAQRQDDFSGGQHGRGDLVGGDQSIRVVRKRDLSPG